jgi:hypothetical protein
MFSVELIGCLGKYPGFKQMVLGLQFCTILASIYDYEYQSMPKRQGDNLNQFTQILIERLEKKGLESGLIPPFIRALGNALLGNPHSSHLYMNKQLHLLGWDDLELDYRTFEVATAWFEAEGLESFDQPLRIKQH